MKSSLPAAAFALGLVLAALPARPLAAEAPAVAAPSCPPPLSIPYTMARLPNGLTVIVHEDHSAPIVSVNTWYHVGSARETPGRTGFAHLFEHIMFSGSKHVPLGAFDRWLEEVGGDNNGSTNTDRTNYFENLPSNALETALFLESDRMGWLLPSIDAARVDQQRDVVKNERRQSYENAPYGMAEILLVEALYPKDHPYSWPTIGSMADLSAASADDVKSFFSRWYGPANTSVVIAGDVDTRNALALAEKWFGEIPKSEPVEPLAARVPALAAEKRLVHEDAVELPRLYLSWPTPPVLSPAYAALEALTAILASGKNSRLYRRLVYELEVAQDVSASQEPGALSSMFSVIVTARAGRSLSEIARLVDGEIARLAAETPTTRELERHQNRFEADVLSRLERLGGKADRLNRNYFHTGNPGYLEQELAATRALAADDVRAAAFRHLGPGRVALSIVPEGRRDLALAPDAAPPEPVRNAATGGGR